MSDVYVCTGAKAKPVAETRELVPGIVLVDFDADGVCLGVEVLGASRTLMDGLRMVPVNGYGQ